jgi:hypothetical protein
MWYVTGHIRMSARLQRWMDVVDVARTSVGLVLFGIVRATTIHPLLMDDVQGRDGRHGWR